jgi:arylsulfatase A-like enzyme
MLGRMHEGGGLQVPTREGLRGPSPPKRVSWPRMRGGDRVDRGGSMRGVLGGLMLPLLAMLGLAGEVPATEGPGRAAGRRPNIVVILADDLGYSDLGCYGGEVRTPNLDGLAAGGLRFTQFYNTARCWPTRAALLTGYYAQQVRRDTVPGVPSGSRGTRPSWARLLPEMLRSVGYRSYHSGKWHVDGMPLAGGFDRSYYVQDLGRYFHPRVLFEDDRPQPPVVPGSGYYATTAIAEHAIEYLRQHARDHAGRPFFLYLAFNAPHFPLHAPPEDVARYRDRYRAGWETIRAGRWRRIRDIGIAAGRLSDVERSVGPPYDFPDALTRLGPGEVNRPLPWGELTELQRTFQATKMGLHAAMVDRMDREIGRVLDQLRAMEALDDTLILFLSDNGASAEIMVRDDGHDPEAEPGSAATHLCLGPGWSTVANTPFRRHKTWVHEGGVATPLIAHWPRGIAARGELRHDPGHVIDLVPTTLEIARARRPETWEGRPVPEPPGRSLVAAFARDGSVHHEALWWEHEGNRAIRVGDWKLVAARGGPWELFDLSTDRAETRDLAREHPGKVRGLARRWQELRDEFLALARRDVGQQPAHVGPGSLRLREAFAQPEAWVDVEKPFWWDMPTWVATGRVRSIGLANNHMCRRPM